MRQLHYTDVGTPELLDVATPDLSDDGLLLRTRYSALSNGTERAVMMGQTYNPQSAIRRPLATRSCQKWCKWVLTSPVSKSATSSTPEPSAHMPNCTRRRNRTLS